jgi:hypothetical protein
MRRVIAGDEKAGWAAFRSLYTGWDSYEAHKRHQLLDFGIGEGMIAAWEAGAPEVNGYGEQILQVLGTLLPTMQRMRPDGVTRLGLYAKSIGDLIAVMPSDRQEIVDFGCGAWVDASLYFAQRRWCNGPVVLVDVRPLSLAFASYQMAGHYWKCHVELVGDRFDASGLISPSTGLVIESTAFEHVRNIRWLFPSMMEALSPGAFFLTNYTRLDWTLPAHDGYQENKDFAAEAVTVAQDLAYRYEWEPKQDPGLGFDLWERK